MTRASLIPSTLFPHPSICSHVSDVALSFQTFSSFLFVLRADPISTKQYILASLHGRIREVQGSNLGIHTANVYGLYSVPPGQDSTLSSRPPPPSTTLPNQHSTVTQPPGPTHLYAVCDQPPSQGPLPECRIPGWHRSVQATCNTRKYGRTDCS